MNVKKLIEQITPLYNYYKDNKRDISAVQALETMWEIGLLLKNYINKIDIKPHNLYREIYGKSEGHENITQKSYITREFLGRCYRIHKIFPKKQKIFEELPKLKSFISFRESMPFFDNPKYKLIGKEKDRLLEILNSNLKSKDVLVEIKKLQSKYINKKNPRTQKLHELEEIKDNFIKIYNEVYKLIKMNDYEFCIEQVKNFNADYFKILSKNTSALSDEGLKYFKFSIPDSIENYWLEYGNNIEYLINQKDAKVRRRFRRLIPPERIGRLVEMLYALTSKEEYDNFI